MGAETQAAEGGHGEGPGVASQEQTDVHWHLTFEVTGAAHTEGMQLGKQGTRECSDPACRRAESGDTPVRYTGEGIGPDGPWETVGWVTNIPTIAKILSPPPE